MQSGSITFVRHGAVTRLSAQGVQLFYGPNEPLNPTGVKQMQEMGKILSRMDEQPSVIYTSPTARAYESAHLIQRELWGTPPVIPETDFRTAYSPQWNDRPIQELIVTGGDMFAENPALPHLLGESLDEVYKRATQQFETLKGRHKNDHIVIVTHGEIIGAIQHYIRVGPEGAAAVDPTVEKGEALFLRFNETGTLYESKIITQSEGHIRKEKE